MGSDSSFFVPQCHPSLVQVHVQHAHVYITVFTVLKDCKSWYEAGYTTSGNYSVYPNGQIPVEVSNDI